MEVHLSGTWTTPITIGASNLRGASYHFSGYRHTGYRLSGASSPIPPGSGNGNGVLVLGPNVTEELYLDVTLPASLAVGTTVTITMFFLPPTAPPARPSRSRSSSQNSCTVF